MSDGNPPSSYYDPPEAEYDYEVNDERIPQPGEICDSCDEPATRRVELRDLRVRYSGWWVVVCKQHYETVVKDAIEAARTYEPDNEGD